MSAVDAPPINIDPAEVKDLEQARALILSLKSYIRDTETPLREELRLTKLQLAEALRRLFGPKSEKIPVDPRQLELLGDSITALEPAAAQTAVVEDEEELTRPRRRASTTPQPTPQIHEVIVTRLEPEEKICPQCGREKCVLGEDCTDKLDIIPARLVTRRTVRPRMACATCKLGVAQAALPPQLVPQGDPAAGLVAHVILSKYVDHVPLHRQEQQFLRLGVAIPRQRLCDWVGHGALWLQALHRAMREEILQGDYLQVDETPVWVMDPELKGRTAQGYLWFYAVPRGDALLDFQPGRGLSGPSAMLESFRGVLQTDDYEVYNSLVARRPGQLKRIGCWAHARRKFFEALADDRTAALEFLSDIRVLYHVERRARDEGLDAAARHKLRAATIPDALARIKVRLDALKPKLLPKSPLGKAVRYALNDWSALCGYLEDGRYELDNNLVENAVRPVAVGRKNYLFLGHPDAAWRSAVIYSLVISCKRRGIDPALYLTDVFRRIPAMTNHQVKDLLPGRWNPV